MGQLPIDRRMGKGDIIPPLQPAHPEAAMRTIALRLSVSLTLLMLPATDSMAAVHNLPNYDALAVSEGAAARRDDLAAKLANPGIPVEWESHFGVPSFVWPAHDAQPLADLAFEAPDLAARRHVAQFAPLYGLTTADVANAVVASVHDTGRGAIVIKLRQQIDGIDVFREELNVVMARDRSLVALAGYLSPSGRSTQLSLKRIAADAATASFALPAEAAIMRAFVDLAPDAQALSTVSLRVKQATDVYSLYADDQQRTDDTIVRPIRARRVWFHLPGGFEPAYHIEIDLGSRSTTDSQLYSYVISAIDGRLLFRKNLTEDQGAPPATPSPFAYRVWADTTGQHRPLNGPQGFGGDPNPSGTNDGFQPDFVAPALLTLGSGPISTADVWLPAGATETNGNNVDAYVDLSPPDGLTKGDFRATRTSTGHFDRAYDIASQPGSTSAQQQAVITQMFYDVNFFHDWYYDSGFDEAAGNAQTDNYGRGGKPGDNIHAEAQDSSGRNNANMSTPADGGHPRMQMYIFDGIGARTLKIDSPSASASDYATGTAQFGPQTFNLSGEVVASSPADACTTLTTSLSGKIAFVDRGTCNFVVKAANVQAAGAMAMVIGNVPATPSPTTRSTMGCLGAVCSSLEKSLPPSMLVPEPDSENLRAQLANGALHATFRRDSAPDRDGALDNQIVAHEWGHYLSNRLIGDSNGLASQQSRGMGEGWSDFLALLLTARPEDTAVASDNSFNGSYPVAGYALGGGANGPLVNSSFYFGIRRVPYSTDMSRDPLTLRHITAGTPLTGALVAFGEDGQSDAEVHNTGEVWTTMLWEAYAALLRDTLGVSPRLTFAEAQQRMKDYIVASLKTTPINPTLLDGRDALLAVAFANDPVDYQELWQAFAKRGAGTRAIASERYSTANLGVHEDFTFGPDVALAAVRLDDSVTSCAANGTLDGGEKGKLTVTVRNSGTGHLATTTGKVTSSDGRLTFANGGAITFPPSDPGQTVTATLQAALAPSSDIIAPTITIDLTDPALVVKGNVSSTFQPRLNVHDEPEQLAHDDVESDRTAWAPSTSILSFPAPAIAPTWTRSEITPRDHHWTGTENSFASDEVLVSPPLTVSSHGFFGFSFRHRYWFDTITDQNGNQLSIDGGVIEITTDDGKSWSDIGDKADPGYGIFVVFSGNQNPLQGRRAFVGTSAGASTDEPADSPFITTTVDLGTAYQGQVVRVRFRLGTGAQHASPILFGWQIDDVAFFGLNNLPFYGLVPDRGLCGVSMTTTVAAVTAAGASTRLIATVSSPSVVPNGTVDFLENGKIVAAAHLIDGVATLPAGALDPGVHTITASFAGSTNFTASQADAITLSVGPLARHRIAGH
jgi:large repetitive protein